MPGPKNEVLVQNGIVVFLDYDDVLGDFHGLFNSLIRKLGYKIGKHYMPNKYSYLDIMSQEDFNKHFDALGDRWPGKLKVFAGAAEFTRRLKELGCRVVILTSIEGHQGVERLKNLEKFKIYYDEAYFTKGRKKSEFANYLLPRYSDTRGNPPKSILIDDYAKNAYEFLQEVPNSLAITMNVPYGREWLDRLIGNKKAFKKAKTPQDLYNTALKVIGKILTKKIETKSWFWD